MRWRNSGATALPGCWCSRRCWWWGWRREAPCIKSASSPNPFVLSLSKHRPSSVAPKERTTLRQAQGERFILTHYALSYRSEEHTSELQSLMRTSYAVFCLKKKKHTTDSDTQP